MVLRWPVVTLVGALLFGGCASPRFPVPLFPPMAMQRSVFTYETRVAIQRRSGSIQEVTVTTIVSGATIVRGRRASERLEFIAPGGSVVAYLDKLPRSTAPAMYEGRFVIELPNDLPPGPYTVRATFFADGTPLAVRTRILTVASR